MRIEHICTICPIGCHLVYENSEITGNKCIRGYTFMMNEIVAPKRNISSTVKIVSKYHKRLPVKTDSPILRELLVKAVDELSVIQVSAPVKIGDIIYRNVLGTDTNFIATRSIKE